MKTSTALKNYRLATGSTKAALDAGFCYVFTGPVPASADDALDMVNDHTQIVKISLSGGATGLTFGAASNGALPKTSSETWEGTITFDGADDEAANLTPTFLRFCEATDTGRGAATTEKRIQATCGGPGNEFVFSDPVCIDNGTNTKGFTVFEIRETDIEG